MKKITVKKGQILQFKGDLNSSVYTIHSGILRSYTIDDKGKEHIFNFAPEGWIIADNAPVDTPCELFIDALEDSTITITGKNFKELEPSVTALARQIAVLQKRVIMLMSASAIERYEYFKETYPDIIQRVPQKMIASYLGVTPEALSKVKGDKARYKK